MKLYHTPMFKIEICITISNLKIMNKLKGLNHTHTVEQGGKKHMVDEIAYT